jgi:transposase
LRRLPFTHTLTVGEPFRNKQYRMAISPKRKADPVESAAAARFALVERPKATPAIDPAYAQLREVAQRLQSHTRQSTRFVNQLHNLLARVFPELSVLVEDLQAGWLLQLLDRYPTPKALARAKPASLSAIPYFPDKHLEPLQKAAAASVASLTGDTAEFLVRQLVGQLRAGLAQQAELKKHLVAAHQALPQPNHLASIPGIGDVTAAVLTAKIGAIERFDTPAQLVSYFGIFPEEQASGVAKDGRLKPGRPTPMSRRGNDLVRKYLWNAAMSASSHNPAVRPLYQRLRRKGVRGDVALGHCMRKLLHLVHAIWRTGQPFDPDHFPWDHEKTAGHNRDQGPERSVVAAVPSNVPATPTLDQPKTETPRVGASGERIDFAALREGIGMDQVLAQLGWLTKLKGAGPQRRGPCPLHAEDQRRPFSVHMTKKIFQCFHCGAQGNILDLWAKVHNLPLTEAARHLANTLMPPPAHGTEKRNP